MRRFHESSAKRFIILMVQYIFSSFIFYKWKMADNFDFELRDSKKQKGA